MLNPFKGRLKGKLVTSLVVLMVAAAAGYGVWYFYGKSSSTTATALTTKVTKGFITVNVSGTGAVQPALNRNVSSTVAGTLAKSNVTNGSKVTKGQLLFQLTSDNLESELKKARIDVEQNQLEYAKIQKQIREQAVYATISGRVTEVKVESGSDVQKNAELLTITDTNHLKVTVSVNPVQVKSIKVGQKADVYLPSMFYSVAGTVTKVDRLGKAAGDGSVMHDVTVQIANPGSLSEGLSANVTVRTPSGSQVGYEAGPLEWASTYTVRAGTAGKITQLNTVENAYVNKGQKLVQTYSEDLGTQLTSQKLKIEQSQLSLAETQNRLADLNIYAPDDGVITLSEVNTDSNSSGGSSSSSSSSSGSGSEIYYQVGDEVGTGTTLAVLTNNGMKVDVSVDEVEIEKIKVGQTATVTIDALPDKKYSGKVTLIDSKGTTSNGVASFTVTVSIGSDPDLKENMTANVEILVAHKDNALLLPVEAVQELGDRRYVTVPANGTWTSTATSRRNSSNRAAGNNNRAGANLNSDAGGAQERQVTVKTGLYNETMIEIVSGLSEGAVVNIPTTAKSSNSNSSSGSSKDSKNSNSRGGMGGIPGGGMGMPGGGR